MSESNSEKLQRLHNEGEQYESQGRIDPIDALARSIAYSKEESEAFEAGRDNVREQKKSSWW